MSVKFSGENQIETVSSFDKLVDTAFEGAVNAVCWERNLAGDFKEIVSSLQLKENLTNISMPDMLKLSLSAAGDLARSVIVTDFKLLENLGALPSLNLIKNYPRDDEFDFISTDVYSYHVDRSPVATDTFLCTYCGAASELIPNAQAEQKIFVPEIRQKLRDQFDGTPKEFDAFLKEYFFDLHYQAKPDALPISLGTGHLWKLAVDHPQQTVLPCIHRAPIENDGEYRLLLIC